MRPAPGSAGGHRGVLMSRSDDLHGDKLHGVPEQPNVGFKGADVEVLKHNEHGDEQNHTPNNGKHFLLQTPDI